MRHACDISPPCSTGQYQSRQYARPLVPLGAERTARRVWDRLPGRVCRSLSTGRRPMDNSCECACDCEGYWQYTAELILPDSRGVRQLFLCVPCARHTALLSERFRLKLALIHRRSLPSGPVMEGIHKGRPQRPNPFAD